MFYNQISFPNKYDNISNSLFIFMIFRLVKNPIKTYSQENLFFLVAYFLSKDRRKKIKQLSINY